MQTCPEDLSGNNFPSNGLAFLMEGLSKQNNFYIVAWILGQRKKVHLDEEKIVSELNVPEMCVERKQL